MITKKKKKGDIHVRVREPGISFDYVIYVSRDRDRTAKLAISQLESASRSIHMAVLFKRIEMHNKAIELNLKSQHIDNLLKITTT